MIYSSANAKKWEVELSTLKSNNARLTAALQESTANVEEWKKQLQAYKEENQRLKQRTLEAEAARGNADAAAELRKEIGLMREKVDFFTQQLKTKDEEIKVLKDKCGTGDSKVSIFYWIIYDDNKRPITRLFMRLYIHSLEIGPDS